MSSTTRMGVYQPASSTLSSLSGSTRGETMFTYHQIKAIQEYRYPTGESRERPRVRRSHVSLPRLITALAAGLARLGLREGKGTRPASPAY
jgi:hypothetical protein